MIRTKIKGTKVRRTPTEEPNFYDPAWKSHFGATIPEYLKKNAFHVVAPPPASGPKKEVTPRASTTKKVCVTSAPVNGTPYVDILPAPSSQAELVVPVSDEESSWDSLDLAAAMDGDLLLFEGNPFHFLERDLDVSANDVMEAVKSFDTKDHTATAFVAI